jgi:hypothetical protein
VPGRHRQPMVAAGAALVGSGSVSSWVGLLRAATAPDPDCWRSHSTTCPTRCATGVA